MAYLYDGDDPPPFADDALPPDRNALEPRPMDPLTDSLRRIETKIDSQDRKIERLGEEVSDIKTQLAVGKVHIDSQATHATRLDALEEFRAEVAVKLGLLWAGCGIAATAAIGALVTALMGGSP